MFEATLPSIHISHYDAIYVEYCIKISDIFNHNGTGYYEVKLPLCITKGFVMIKNQSVLYKNKINE